MFTLDYTTMVNNLAALAGMGGPVWMLVNAFCYMMALLFAFSSAMQLKEAAEQQRYGYRGPVYTFFAAAMMATAPSMFVSFMATFFGGQVATSPLQYSGPSSANNFGALMKIISLIGYFFFVRGIYELRKAGDPQRFQGASVGKALTIAAAGMLAIYIDVTLWVVGDMMGWDVSNYVTQPPISGN